MGEPNINCANISLNPTYYVQGSKIEIPHFFQLVDHLINGLACQPANGFKKIQRAR